MPARICRLLRLAEADRYGEREEFWLQANLLLSQAQLREMAAAFERELYAVAADGSLPLANAALRWEP